MWNPAHEAWPGGPHPGQIAALEQQRLAQVQMEAATTRAAQERMWHLLLLRG